MSIFMTQSAQLQVITTCTILTKHNTIS